ncbi:MAG: sensor domain-containing diguanylate cyclase [Actinomycetia bacterium]|nr:sensor domain-containing diguanylate cyclase [Actinomycetes bacterium]
MSDSQTTEHSNPLRVAVAGERYETARRVSEILRDDPDFTATWCPSLTALRVLLDRETPDVIVVDDEIDLTTVDLRGHPIGVVRLDQSHPESIRPLGRADHSLPEAIRYEYDLAVLAAYLADDESTEARVREALTDHPAAVFGQGLGVLVLDGAENIVHSSPTAADLLHSTEGDLLGRRFSIGPTGLVSRRTLLVPDGSATELELESTPTTWHDADATVVVLRTVDDPRARVLARRPEPPLKRADSGLLDWDLSSDQIYCSVRARRLLGFTAADEFQRLADIMDLIHPDDRDRADEAFTRIRTGELTELDLDIRFVGSSGADRPISIQGLVLPDDAHRRLMGTVHVINADDEPGLFQDASTDPVTGLANRALFADRLDQGVARTRRAGQITETIVALLLDGIDGRVTELGPEGIDVVLRTTARRLAELTQPGDTLAHLGRGQFAFLLHDTSAAEALHFAEVAVERMGQRTLIDVGQVAFTGSAGVNPVTGVVAVSPLELAIRAATEATERGGNLVMLARSTDTGGEPVIDLRE